MKIEKAAVIGAGVMGSGIAAQIANAGIPVLLFDLDAPVETIAKMAAQGPSGPFMREDRAKLVEALSLKTDLDRLGEVDWICEVIVENLDVKRDLYEKIETRRRPHSIISSNTSTIPLAQLIEGRSPAFAEHFVITHFFNPPRPMRLLEFVPGKAAQPTADVIREFCEDKLGKGIVPCFDRPGFIANRIGVYWLMRALHTGIAQNIDIDTADAALNKLYGIPKTGAFGLIDLIGLDLMPKMAQSLASNLADSDKFHEVAKAPQLLNDMIAAGYTGRKGKGGFNRMQKNEDGSKTKLTLDLSKPFNPDSSYRPSAKTAPAEAWAKSLMDDTLDYTTALLGEVSDDKAAIDAAMVWGYGWRKGPFALRGETIALPHPKRAVFVQDLKVIEENDLASLRDAGDGVAVFALKTKMNVLDKDAFTLLHKTLDRDLKALVIATDEAHFSAGANVAHFLAHDAETFVDQGRAVMQKLRVTKYPVVAAVNGFAIGGGCELSLHSSAIVAHAETQIGLVEPRVGVVPGWGGCLEALQRLGALEALKAIMAQWTSASALDAQDKGYIAPGDPIVMNRDLVLAEAIELSKTLRPEKHGFKAANGAEIDAMKDWLDTAPLSEADRVIATHLVTVLSAPDEAAIWAEEKKAFMALLQTVEAKKRIEAVLSR